VPATSGIRETADSQHSGGHTEELAHSSVGAKNSPRLLVRTVEGHLQRTYEKLGISSRRGLVGALRDQRTA
jgi:hypothetical protein